MAPVSTHEADGGFLLRQRGCSQAIGWPFDGSILAPYYFSEPERTAFLPCQEK
jgi:hypothetical protein